MPNVIVTIGSTFGSNQTEIIFRNSKGSTNITCKDHPLTHPFRSAELNTNDIAELMHFLLDSIGSKDERKKSNLERFAGSDAGADKEDLQTK